MAFYRVTIWLDDERIIKQLRELEISNIDHATDFFTWEASQQYKNVMDIEAAMLSANCTEIRRFIARQPNK